jgi:non-ribosomal peptide synthetase component F
MKSPKEHQGIPEKCQVIEPLSSIQNSSVNILLAVFSNLYPVKAQTENNSMNSPLGKQATLLKAEDQSRGSSLPALFSLSRDRGLRSSLPSRNLELYY